MTSAFQTVIDNAETLNFNKRRKVAVTESRDGTVKTLSLGGQPWRFDVKLPDGKRWADFRGLIEGIEYLDKVTPGTIQLNKTGHAWITGYQGNISNPNINLTVNYTTTGSNTVTVGTGIGWTVYNGQYRFKAGDLIQLTPSGPVYSVVYDVPYNGNTITTHRPIRETTTGSYTLTVGQSVTWNVVCTNYPQWTLVERDRIQWNGSFQFTEVY